MDPDPFIRWALDDARTVEERYATELLVEFGESMWRARRELRPKYSFEDKMALQRQRNLNPAYEPSYSEEGVRQTAEMIPQIKQWWLSTGYQQRPIRDLSVLRFLTAVENLSIGCEAADISVVADMPSVRELTISSAVCEDWRPLARCTWLRSLSLAPGVPWPELAGIENLQQLDSLSLAGNLLAFERGIVFARVRKGGLTCSPLAARNMRELPQLPACEFLTLGGVERLDGIERFPRLRNLTLTGPVRDFSPLAVLDDLTCLTYTGGLPLDVAPLARLRTLFVASFTTQHRFGLEQAPPRDYSPITASPTLRELRVAGCPPQEMEIAAINATLPPWDDLFLAHSPRPVPPLRIVVAPQLLHPRRDVPHRGPGEPDLPDTGVRQCEGAWAARFVQKHVSERIAHEDWGRVDASGEHRLLAVWVECYEVVERLPEILDAAREAMARIHQEYLGSLYIRLRVPPPKMTPVHLEMLKRYRDEMDEAEQEQSTRDRLDALERRYLYELKKQAGDKIDPEEFAPGERDALPPPPWERESDDDDDDSGEGGIAVKHKPDPPPDPYDDDHPLADNYRLAATFTMDAIWFDPRQSGLALHLMGRDADEVIPADDEKR